MSPESSPLPVPAPGIPAPAAPEVSANLWRWGGLRAAAPAFLLFALWAGLRGAAMPRVLEPITASFESVEGASLERNGVLSPGQTMIVSARKSSGAVLLRARLQPSVSVVGRAPISGQVARVMVNTGEFVQVDERVLQISTGASTRRAAPSERAQMRAERAQVDAAKAQESLQGRLQGAQQRLAAAQDRVERARQRVEEAQSVIEKMQRGEIPLRRDEESSETPSAPEPERTVPTRVAPSSAQNAANHDALQDAQTAQRAAQRDADRAAQKAAGARRAVGEAEQEVRSKTAQLMEARAALESAQSHASSAKSDVGGKNESTTKSAEGAKDNTNSSNASASSSAVSAAKSALAAAEAAAAEARAKAQSARNAASSAERAATAEREQARQSTDKARALRNLQNLPLFSDAPNDEKPARRPVARRNTGRETRSSSVSSVAEAARLVQNATSESREAVEEARRIKEEVDQYERQVRSTERQLNTSGERLEEAQQQVMDNTIRANLSVVRAPASGVVLWVAPIADEVGSGETIITIGRSEVLEARLSDNSGAWRNLKRDDVLTGVVQAAPNNDNRAAADARDASAAQGAAASQGAIAAQSPTMVANDAIPVMARVREVIAPTRDGEPAVLRVAVFNPRRPLSDATRARTESGATLRRRFRSGMALICSVDRPGSRASISVPEAAVLREGNERALVAVLSPLPPSSTQESSGAHRIEWRPVTLGAGNGVQREIVSGLNTGERIALQPLALRSFTLENGPQATVRVG